MHIRHFVLSGLIAGATLFLPNNAFADKNEPSEQHNSENASVQSETSAKSSNLQKTTVQSKAKNAKIQQGGVIQDPPQSSPKLEPTQKAAVVLENLPDQAKAKVQSAIKKSEKVIKSPGLEKVATVKEHSKELKKKKKAIEKVAKNSSLHALHKIDPELKDKAESKRMVNKSDSIEKAFSHSILEKGNSSVPYVPKPQKKENTPTGKKEFPEANQLTNSAQRTNSSGGQSNDRVSYGGLSTVSFLDKWFEWNKFYEIKLIQPYLSRQALMKNQWVHAPPSPPPKTAPLLKMVNRC
ncbi:MAG TPA: hypothetical protein VEV44_00605 [Pseudoneobacillus sp.]|nr:hypothetical protein [Pseudoneobacillus sp.]